MVAPSNLAAGVAVSAIHLYRVSASGSPAAILPAGVTAGFDFTSSSIASSGDFRGIHPTGSAAKVTFFQYNPFKQRIYLMTNESGLLHIFNNTSTDPSIVNLWSNSNRYALLQYAKALAVAGTMDNEGVSSGGKGTTTATVSMNACIEIDQDNGQEMAMVMTMSGSVVRIPWME